MLNIIWLVYLSSDSSQSANTSILRSPNPPSLSVCWTREHITENRWSAISGIRSTHCCLTRDGRPRQKPNCIGVLSSEEKYSMLIHLLGRCYDRRKCERKLSIHIGAKKPADVPSDIRARAVLVLRIFGSWSVWWILIFDNYDNPHASQTLQTSFSKVTSWQYWSQVGTLILIRCPW